MRVLLATDAVGGVWVYSCELRAALLDAGIEVVLATLGPQPPPEADVRYCACRLEWQEDPWASVARSGRWLVDLSEEHDVDVVQLAGYAHGALRWPVPTVIVAH